MSCPSILSLFISIRSWQRPVLYLLFNTLNLSGILIKLMISVYSLFFINHLLATMWKREVLIVIEDFSCSQWTDKFQCNSHLHMSPLLILTCSNIGTVVGKGWSGMDIQSFITFLEKNRTQKFSLQCCFHQATWKRQLSNFGTNLAMIYKRFKVLAP